MASEILAGATALPGVRARHPGYWRLTSALMLQVLAVSFALVGLIDGPGWWFSLLFASAVILVTGAGLRMLGVRRGWVPLLLFVEFAMIMTLFFGRGTGLLGLIPTPATFARFVDLSNQAALSIYQQGTPADALPEFMFLIVGGGCLIAIVLDTLAITLRTPAFTALGVAVVLVVPATLLGNGLDPIALATSATAYLWLLRCDTRTRRPGTPRSAAALSISAASVVVAVILSGTAPGFDRGGATSFTAGGVSIGGTVTPLIDLGRDLRRPAAVRTLTYTTTAVSGQYLKLASLDEFTGAVWKHRERDTKRLPAGNTIGPAVGLSNSVATAKITTSIVIDNMQSRWLPVPYPVQGIKGLTGTWSWDPDDLTIGGVNATTQGQQYVATSVVLQPTVAQLQAAGGFVPTSIERDLSLPRNLPSIIGSTALAATAGAVSEYSKAVALQDYFRNNDFVYSTQTPLKQGYDGDGSRVIAKFLEVKSGYCVHFASAMALMARTLGIPSRVAEGYLPGVANGGTANNPGEYTVTSDDLHAWPELYFAGVGWVAFEPTVGRGTIPAYTRPDASTTPLGQQPGSASSAAGRPVPRVGRSDIPNPTGAAPDSAAQPIASGFGVALLVVILLLTPAMFRRVRRRRRLRRVTDEWGGAAQAWDELHDTARDLGWAVPNTETPRTFANRISAAVAGTPGEDAVSRLLLAREREAYGPPAPATAVGLKNDLARVLSALEGQAGAPLRAKAMLLPASLIPPSWSVGTTARG
ncbi:MAG: transglutaminaseTgpA domain-containing protein [Actinomycetales bacterium]